jgi:DNA processing protein
MDQTDKMTYWLALKGINGLGIGGVKNLLDALKTPAAVFKASYAVLSAVPGIGKNLAGQIRNFKDWAGVERELETARREQIHIVPFQDPTFPIPLKNIYDCPLLLYAKAIGL